MAESDEWATVETVDDSNYPASESEELDQQTSSGMSENYLNLIYGTITSNGWYIVLTFAVLYILWQKYVAGRKSGDTSTILSPEEILSRQEAIETARQRMQEQYDAKAKEFAAKQKEKEEILRQQKLQNLEKYGTVLGRSSKTTVADTNNTGLSVGIKRKPDKPKLRPEYNPLMGDSSSGACFRPSRRSGAAGG